MMNGQYDSKFLDDPEFQSLLVACLESLQRGESIDRDALANDYPKYAGEIGRFLEDQVLLQQVASQFGDVEPSKVPLAAYEDTLDSKAAGSPAERGDFTIGESIRYIGEYEILDKIAQGGMGIVFKARQQKLNRIVALKMILAGKLADSSDIERFQREARAAGRLKHPNIVPVHEIGEYDRRHYFTMDYVDGPSLADEIREESLRPRRAAEIVKSTAEAVQFAHEQGTVHRDLKPANILITDRQTPHITDFGLAKMLESVDEESRAELTATGQILGTPSYMSPEQASGKQELVGPPTDIYSLGAILYACLTGRAPFIADSPVDTLLQVMRKEPVSPRVLNPSVPKDLETICLKCLNKEPHRRYGTAGELADDLNRFLQDRPVTARPVGPITRSYRWCQRNPVVAALAVLLFASLATGTVVASKFAIDATRHARQEERQREQADAERRKAEQQRILAIESKRDAEQQRDVARFAEEQAEAALVNEAAARILAENATQRALWQTYVARLQPIRQAWLEKEYGHLARLLQQSAPAEGEPDFRGWEWWFFADQIQEISPRLSGEIPFTGEFVFDRPRSRMFARSAGKLLIWDFGKKSVVKSLSIPGGRCLTISPDGKFLAIATGDIDVVVWDIEADALLVRLPSHEDNLTGKRGAHSTFWSPDGTKLLTASRQGELRIWNRSDWSLDEVLLEPSHRNAMGGMDWHPQSGLVTGHRFGWFRVWDMDTGKVVHTGRTGVSIIEHLKWSPSGDKFAIAEEGLGIWSADGERIGEHRDFGYTPAIAWLDDQMIACGGEDQHVVVCDVSDESADKTLRVHSGQVCSLGRLNEKTIISGAIGDGIRLVNLDVQNPGIASVRAHENDASEVEWSPDGERLATVGRHQRASVRDADSLQEEFSLVHDNEPQRVWDVDWNSSGDRLATVNYAGLVTLWDAHNGTLVKQRRVSGVEQPQLDWRPSNEFIVLGGRKPQVIDADTLETVWVGNEEMGATSWKIQMHFSPDGKRAIGNSIYGTVKVIGLDPPSFERGFATRDPGDGAGVWSPDGLRFVAAGADLSVYDTQSFKRLMRLEGHRGPVGGVCYHPGGSRIASAGHDGQVYLWDTDTGDLLVRLPILDQTGLTAINFSPDGSRLATVNRAGNLIVLGRKEAAIPKEPDTLPEYVERPEVQLAKLTLAIGKDPDSPKPVLDRAHWFAKHLRWSESLADFETFLKANPESVWHRCEAAMVALMCNDNESYQRHLMSVIDNRSDWDFSHDFSKGAFLAEVAAVVPDSVEDLKAFKPLANRQDQANLDQFYEVKSIALIELRLGNFERVLQLLQPHANRRHHLTDQVFVDSIRALALDRLKRHDEADAALQKAEQTAAEAWPEPLPNEMPTYGDATVFVLANRLLQEARSVLSRPNADKLLNDNQWLQRISIASIFW